MMGYLELQAVEKTREKDQWKKATVEVLKEGRLNQRQLEVVIEKVFSLGHNAGHCRGEDYKNKHLHNIVERFRGEVG